MQKSVLCVDLLAEHLHKAVLFPNSNGYGSRLNVSNTVEEW